MGATLHRAMYAVLVPDLAYRERAAVALRAAMLYRDMTTDDVADAIGMSPETVRRWLRTDRGISAEEASRLTEVLNAPSDLFIRPPETRERALAMMVAWDALRDA